MEQVGLWAGRSAPGHPPPAIECPGRVLDVDLVGYVYLTLVTWKEQKSARRPITLPNLMLQ